jgi:DNA-binding IscR family transcriptional regulator
MNVCLIGPGACPRDETCPVHPVWVRVQEVVRRELAAETLSALAAEGQRLKAITAS